MTHDAWTEEEETVAFVKSDEFIDAVLEEAESVAGLRPFDRERRYRRNLRGGFGPTTPDVFGAVGAVDMIDGEVFVASGESIDVVGDPAIGDASPELAAVEPLSDEPVSGEPVSGELAPVGSSPDEALVEDLPSDDLSEDLLDLDAARFVASLPTTPLIDTTADTIADTTDDETADEVVVDVTDAVLAGDLAASADTIVLEDRETSRMPVAASWLADNRPSGSVGESLVAVPWLDGNVETHDEVGFAASPDLAPRDPATPEVQAPAAPEPVAELEPAAEVEAPPAPEPVAESEPAAEVEAPAVPEPVAELPSAVAPIAAQVQPAAVVEYQRPAPVQVKRRRHRLRRARHDFREFMIRRGGGAPRVSLLARWRRARLRRQRLRRNAATQAALMGYGPDTTAPGGSVFGYVAAVAFVAVVAVVLFVILL